MESLKRSNSFVFNDSITQSRNDINDSILPQLPAYATKMRQWRQMRQMRHFYFSPGISHLEGQQGGGGVKSGKSVAFCHTGRIFGGRQIAAAFSRMSRTSLSRIVVPLRHYPPESEVGKGQGPSVV